MAENKDLKETSDIKSKFSGIPMTEEELEETIQCWKDIEECFNNLGIIGEDENNE